MLNRANARMIFDDAVHASCENVLAEAVERTLTR